MFKNAPLPLIVIMAIYLPVELALVFIWNYWGGLIPIALVTVLFYFAAQGHRIASIIWGTLWLFGAGGAGYMAIQFIRVHPYGAVAMALYCVFFLASVGYLFFSPELRRFYARSAESK